MFVVSGFAIVFVGHTLGFCALVGDVMVGNSDGIGYPGKVSASCSLTWRVIRPGLALPSL